MLTVRDDQGFKDENVRLAAHHAIDKAALSKAFYGGAAVPLSVIATPGTPGYLDDYKFPYDPELAKQLLAKSGFSPDKPAKMSFATTNGHFPSDYDMARAIAQMWKKVGIDADLAGDRICQIFRAQPRRQAAGSHALFLGQRHRRSGDLHRLPAESEHAVHAWKDMEIGDKVLGAVQRRRLRQAHRRLQGSEQIRHRDTAPPSPCCKACRPRAQEDPDYAKFGNGWVLANKMQWG